MIDITVKEGWYVVTAPKCTPVLTRAQFIAAPKRGKWWKCRQASRARVASADVRPN